MSPCLWSYAVNPPMNPKVSWEVVDTPDLRLLLVLVEKSQKKLPNRQLRLGGMKWYQEKKLI